ncbi:PAS domain S-box protein [Ideonella margarita]|uniref:histidine kinase n=1 Tax=Ideonella margarita TaxID=2984191 RepID=A0ABU9C064_9BURK
MSVSEVNPAPAASAGWQFSPSPQLLLDDDDQVLAANPAALALWGLAERAVVGRPLADLLQLQADGLSKLQDRQPGTEPAGELLVQLQIGPKFLAQAPPTAPEGQGKPPAHQHIVALLVQPATRLGDWAGSRMLDNLPAGVLRYDASLELVEANPAALAFFGRSQVQQARHRADDEVHLLLHEDGRPVPPSDRPAVRALRTGQPVTGMTIGVHTAHGLRWAQANAEPLPVREDGSTDGVVVTFADITGRVEAMQALRESESRFRLFAEASQDVIWMSRPSDGRTLYVSPAFERLWGLPVQALYDQQVSWMDCIHPDDRQAVADAYFGTTVERPFEAEYRVVRPDGSMIWVRDRGKPVLDALGGLSHLVGMAEDITLARAAKEAEHARQQAEQQVARLVATAPGVLISYRLDANGRGSVHIANPRIGSAYGIGQGLHDIRDVVHAADRARMRQAFTASAQTMKAFREEFRVQHPKYGEIWVELHAMPVKVGDGVIEWHGFMHEITSRKRVDDEIRRVNAELEARVAERTAELEARHREMEAFTYSVSHDLKAPLRGIDGYSRLLEADHASDLNAEGRSFIETIRKATVHMGRLIDDLLAYSRVERSRPTLAPLNPSTHIQQWVAERRRELDEQGVTLSLTLEAQHAVAERDGLGLVMRNLLDNAIKFTAGREERVIRVACEVHETGCRITVSDNGPGFDMRYHDRIFEIFQRLHRAEDYPGTGVGLAIVRKAVERMKGRVRAHSEPGQGATFVVELPG